MKHGQQVSFLVGRWLGESCYRRSAPKHRRNRLKAEESAPQARRFFVSLSDSHKRSIDDLIRPRTPSYFRAFLQIVVRQLRDQMRRVVRHAQAKVIRSGKGRGFYAVAGIKDR